MPIPVRLLKNRVVLQKRVPTSNATGEVIDTYPTETGPFPASVQDGATTELNVPDLDGPVIVSALIFANPGAIADEVRHLDRLRQTDVSPSRLYRVIFDNDAAGWHHHFEFKGERLVILEAEVS